tara:strand:+ start:268 stop:498 length:231 start_codon:yes stop_codon:yes gene_type:complete
MTKIFLFLMLLSQPNQPSVKYNAFIYATEQECIFAKEEYMNAYKNKSKEYKSKVVTNGYCIPFESFEITTLQKIGA